MVEDLNLGQPRINPARGQGGTQTGDRQIASPTSLPLGHAYMGRQTLEKSDMLVSTRKTFSRSFFHFHEHFPLCFPLQAPYEKHWYRLRGVKSGELQVAFKYTPPEVKKAVKKFSFFFLNSKTQINQEHTFAFIQNKNHRHTSQFIKPLVYILFSSKNQTFAGRN